MSEKLFFGGADAIELTSILKQCALAELQPGATYLLVVDKCALPEATIEMLPHAFKAHGLKSPIIVRKWSGELHLYKLGKE